MGIPNMVQQICRRQPYNKDNKEQFRLSSNNATAQDLEVRKGDEGRVYVAKLKAIACQLSCKLSDTEELL